jgi:hypothetical protein
MRSLGESGTTPSVRRGDFNLKFGLIAALVATMFALAAPASSTAATDGYQCGLMNPNTWCRNYAARNFWYNESHETYTGQVFVCLKEIRQSNGSEYAGACGYTPVSHTFPLCNCGGLWPMMENLASGPRQLYGIAYY